MAVGSIPPPQRPAESAAAKAAKARKLQQVYSLIKTPGMVSGWFRGHYTALAAYSQARSVIKTLRDTETGQTALRPILEQSKDFRYMVRYLGAVFATQGENFFYRGLIARSALDPAAQFAMHALQSKFNVTIGVDHLKDVFTVDSTTPTQVVRLAFFRNLFWSLVNFPVYGFYLRFIEPHIGRAKLDSPYNLAKIQSEVVKAYSPRVVEGVAAPFDLQTKLLASTAKRYSYANAMKDAIIYLAQKIAEGRTVSQLAFDACEAVTAHFPFMTQAMLYRVREIDGREQAKAVGWSGKRGTFHYHKVGLIAKAQKGDMRYDLWFVPKKAFEQFGKIKEALIWNRLEELGYVDSKDRRALQDKFNGNQKREAFALGVGREELSYEEEGRIFTVLQEVDSVRRTQAHAREEAEAKTFPHLSAEIEAEIARDGLSPQKLEHSVRFTSEAVPEQVAGTSSLVARSIMEQREIICTDVRMQADGTATAVDLITHETIYPNPVGMQALDVWEFFTAPFSGGVLLGAVDLPRDVSREEILYIMEAYRAYARLVGSLMEGGDHKARADLLVKKLSALAPDEAIEALKMETEVATGERNYVTAFLDLMDSTDTDRKVQTCPGKALDATNAVFDLAQRSLRQVAFSGNEAASLVEKYPQLFERALLLGEFVFRLDDIKGNTIEREYIETLDDPELLALWDRVNLASGDIFNYAGDALLGAISAADDGGVGEIQAGQVRRMISSLVHTARRLAHHNKGDHEITYNLKMAIHGGFAAAGLLGSKDRAAYTLKGYQVDVNARLADAHKGWINRARELGCRQEESQTLPILVSEPMMRVLMESDEGRRFINRYVADFNDYILSGLLGGGRYDRLAHVLGEPASCLVVPLADLIVAFVEHSGKAELLKGFKPLHELDLFKRRVDGNAFDLEGFLGKPPRGMGGDRLGFMVLEWDIHAYHPHYKEDFDPSRIEWDAIAAAEIQKIIDENPAVKALHAVLKTVIVPQGQV